LDFPPNEAVVTYIAVHDGPKGIIEYPSCLTATGASTGSNSQALGPRVDDFNNASKRDTAGLRLSILK
jgi:hypothetical protein